MKFTITWLKKFLDTEADAETISNTLTSLGLEVESVVDRFKDYKDFVVGLVQEVKKHPNADKLNWCKVNIGKELIEIVTGATNVREGMKVVVAPVGSVIPTNKLKMEKRKLRGIESHGMMCSEAELGIGDESGSIIDLPNHWMEGTKLTEVFPELAECLIEISVTANRGDCLGVYGIARDLAAAGLGKLKKVEPVDLSTSSKQSTISVAVEDNNDCSLYLGRYFSNITNCESPEWLKSILRSIGDTPISALVDITNYISYSFARPLHVYDADSIKGGIVVRNAKNDERFIDLDKKEHSLTTDDIVITDNEKVLGLAGIIGGDTSKCELSSKNVFLEAAVFNPIKITKCGRRTGIHTDARHIFERGVDHNFTLAGAILASNLIQEICGGEASEITIVGKKEIDLKTIAFDTNKIEKLSGIKISSDETIEILRALGFGINGNNIAVPSWRHDISCDEDLVEEVLRIYGYDKIPCKVFVPQALPHSQQVLFKYNELASAKSVLAARGYHELVTLSFMSQTFAKKFGIFAEELLIKNPISSELDILRQSITPNLLQVIYRNNARSLNNLSVFEIGPIFNSDRVGDQRLVISALRAGSVSEENIYKDSRHFDFFDVKQDVLALLDLWGIDYNELEMSLDKIPSWYHPGKSATLKLKGKIIGHCGEIHPSILEDSKTGGTVVGFELFKDSIITTDRKKDVFISDYQAVSRDFAFIVDQALSAASLVKIIASADLALIKNVHIFDVYQGPGVEISKKSIAVRVTLQAQDRTLSQEDISLVSDRIIKSVQEKAAGKLRA